MIGASSLRNVLVWDSTFYSLWKLYIIERPFEVVLDHHVPLPVPLNQHPCHPVNDLLLLLLRRRVVGLLWPQREWVLGDCLAGRRVFVVPRDGRGGGGQRRVEGVGWGKGREFETVVVIVVMVVGCCAPWFGWEQVQVWLQRHRGYTLLYDLFRILVGRGRFTLSGSGFFETIRMKNWVGCMLISGDRDCMMPFHSTRIWLNWGWSRLDWLYRCWGWPQDFWKVFDEVVIKVPLRLWISE